ncbi:MAG: hypothetical protein K0Q50_3156, partial [Vampirovibrio sp.]|nr:hypothetical protein [Vampirovibrio sp.]
LAGLSENEWLGDLEKNIHWQLSRLELMALEPQL